MPIVTLQILTDDPSPVAIEGMVVEFYSTSAVFQTGGTTDADGEIQVTLPDADYDVLFFKVGVSILPRQPQRITVDTALVNSFSIVGHVRETPESTDPIKCTVSGHIFGAAGQAAKHRLIFAPVRDLLVIGNNVIGPASRFEVSSDDDGYFEFELLREVCYTCYFLFPQDLFCTQPGKVDVIVPDQPAADLDALLFPLPINMTFSTNAITLTVGDPEDETTEADLTFSDGSERDVLSTPWAYVSVTNTDSTIVEASLRDGILYLEAVAAGTATITTVRVIPSTVLFNPVPDYTTESVVVTVI